MRYLFIFTIIIVLFSANAVEAKVIMIINSDTKEVLSLSDRDDAVVPDGYEKIQLSGNLKDIPLDFPVDEYKYVGNRFVVNTSKQNDKAQNEKKHKDKIDEKAMVENRAFKNACVELEGEGVNFKEISCDDFN